MCLCHNRRNSHRFWFGCKNNNKDKITNSDGYIYQKWDCNNSLKPQIVIRSEQITDLCKTWRMDLAVKKSIHVCESSCSVLNLSDERRAEACQKICSTIITSITEFVCVYFYCKCLIHFSFFLKLVTSFIMFPSIHLLSDIHSPRAYGRVQ